jgi:hypothetical protein
MASFQIPPVVDSDREEGQIDRIPHLRQGRPGPKHAKSFIAEEWKPDREKKVH